MEIAQDDRFPSVGEDVIATIGGQPREGRVSECYSEGPFVLFAVQDARGEVHADLLPHVVRKKRARAS